MANTQAAVTRDQRRMITQADKEPMPTFPLVYEPQVPLRKFKCLYCNAVIVFGYGDGCVACGSRGVHLVALPRLRGLVFRLNAKGYILGLY